MRHASANGVQIGFDDLTELLRGQLGQLAVSLGGEPAAPRAEDAARTFAEFEPSPVPDSRYARRMATFHDFDGLALWGFLTSGTYAVCPPGRILLAEGHRRRPASSP